MFIIIFLIPNIAGSLSLRFTPVDQKVGRLISYYLTGPYNAAAVILLSLQTANTAGEWLQHAKYSAIAEYCKQLMSTRRTYQESCHKRDALHWLLHW